MIDAGSGNMKVSVAMVTYNHERFITQAIEGVLMQQTDFPIELVVGEDCSTDDTRMIVQGYAQRYPQQIRLLLNERNQGPSANFAATLEACRGQYIALCEGDDYWTDPLKLQKQVDFLETHPDCMICFHQSLRIYDDQDKAPYFLVEFNGDQIFKKEQLYANCMIQTCSVLYRRIPMGDFFEKSARLKIGDWPLFVYLAQFGDIGYLDEVMSVYRIHAQGAWNRFGQKGSVEAEVEVLEFFKSSGLFEISKEFYDSLFRRYYKLALLSQQPGEEKIANQYLVKCLSLLPHSSIILIRFFVSLFIQIKLPKLYSYRESIR